MKNLGLKSCSFVFIFISIFFVVHPRTALAIPLWETDFGGVLLNLSGEDEETQSVSLSTSFPFLGPSYANIVIGTNGGLSLGSVSSGVNFDTWSNFSGFLSDPSAPKIYPFNTDLDLTSKGGIHFNDLGNRFVITWNEVGSAQNPTATFTFQTQLFDSGEIVMAWNGIPDDLIADPIGDLDEGIIVGISRADDSDPGPSNFVDAPFDGGTVIYEIWCYDGGTITPPCTSTNGLQLNSTFDLDDMALIYTPLTVQQQGFNVSLAALSAPPESVPEPDILVLLGSVLVALLGNNLRKKNKR
ncbi:MAG: hypothetical protein ACE5FY_07860 [Nitrospiria bacterium]